MATIIVCIDHHPLREMDSDIDKRIKDAGLGDWCSTLAPEAIRILSRYTGRLEEGQGPKSSLLKMAQAANEEENHKFAILLAEEGLKVDGDSLEHYLLLEEMILAHAELNRLADAKQYCEMGLELIPEVLESLKESNGGEVPKDMACRNRMIDIVVGIEGDYERAGELLGLYLDMGLIDQKELDYRTQSLKIHRLQRTLDSVYSVRFK